MRGLGLEHPSVPLAQLSLLSPAVTAFQEEATATQVLWTEYLYTKFVC